MVNIIRACALLTALCCGTVSAAPLSKLNETSASVMNTNIARAQEFPPPGMVQTWYMRREQRNPLLPLVFYNVDPHILNRAQIRRVAAQYNALSLYDVYLPDSDIDGAPFNPSRGPYYQYAQLDELRDWFRYTSRVFAQVGRNNVAYLIWDGQRPFDNFNAANMPNANWHAIWASDEFDAIVRGQTAIDTIYLIDPVTLLRSETPYWIRGQPIPDGWHVVISGANRESDDTACDRPNGPDQSQGPQGPSVKSRADIDHGVDGSVESVQTTGTVIDDQEVNRRDDSPYDIQQRPDQAVFSPGQDSPWVPGKCGIHWIETIEIEEATHRENYIFSVTLYDDDQTNQIGDSQGQQLDVGYTWQIYSRLPYPLRLSHGQNDDLSFEYAGNSFNTAVDPCTGGTFDGLKHRSGDCSFDCNQFQ